MNRPSLTPRGTYDPVELLDYLDECVTDGLRHDQIARRLRVDIDRITYALGKGRPMFERRAREYLAMRDAA